MFWRTGVWGRVAAVAVVAVGAGVAGGAGGGVAGPGARAGGAGPGADVAVIHQLSTAGQWAVPDVPQWQAALAAPAAPRGIPTATGFYGVSTVGALFTTMGGARHFCTAAVVNSTAGDLVLTAAHCVDAGGKAGFAANAEFVPGYHDGRQPYGAWAVREIIVAAGWHQSHDPDLDFAFLAVGRAGGPRIQARTGGLTVGYTRWYRETIEAIGYNDGAGVPVGCRTKSFEFRAGQMEFYCRNFWSGTSGGPWITGYRAKTGTGTVFGVIGGYQAGGDYDWASYSPYFGHDLRVLFGQAEKKAG